MRLQQEGLDDKVCEVLGLDETPEADMREWRNLENRVLNLSKKVKIALVGKYVSLQDAYLSVAESLRHAGYAHDA